MIYSCFAGVGKTTLADIDSNFIDLESSDYQWKYTSHFIEDKEERKGIDEKVRLSEFPTNYVDEMERQLQEGKKVLISSQPMVLEEIRLRGLPFITVTPDSSLKEEYINRYKKRGNNEHFVKLLEDNFENFSEDLSTNKNAIANFIIRRKNTYLSEIL